MKVYYIAPASTDYTVVGGRYETPVYDLYDNDFYKNYCTTKSRYGLDLLGDGTWTGMNRLSSTETESGFIHDGRFVDTTGRVVIAAPIFNMEPQAQGYDITASIEVYTSDIAEHPEDWALQESVEINQEFNMSDTDRYIRFVIALDNPNAYAVSSSTFDFAVRVEIDKPIMSPFYDRARIALDKFPDWMAMREADNPATPSTVGGNLINSIMGEWSDRIAADLSYLHLQRFINTVDLNQPDWVYEYTLTNIDWFSRIVDSVSGKELSQTFDLDEFYRMASSDDAYFWSESNHKLFTRKPYSQLVAFQGVDYVSVGVPGPYHVWNWIDDIGLLVELDRLHLESNEHYRKRILDVYINRPGAGIESFKNSLRRELDIWSAYGATPDSYYEGATPEVLEMSDLEEDATYTYPNGLPRQKFFTLVKDLAEQYPTTWGQFYWGKSFWDVAGDNYAGYDSIPLAMDTVQLEGDDAEFGIGDHNDLYMYSPDAYTGPHQFVAELALRGKHKEIIENAYPEVTVTLSLTGIADRQVYNNPVETQNVKVLVTSTGAAAAYHTVVMSTQSDIDFVNQLPTPDSFDEFSIFDATGQMRRDIVWLDAVTNVQVPADDLWGYAETANILTTLVTEPAYDAIDVFYSTSPIVDGFPTEYLGYSNPGSHSLVTTEPDALPSVYMRSRASNLASSPWNSQEHIIEATLNGGTQNTQSNYVINMPSFEWPDRLADPANKRCLLKVLSKNEAGAFGGFTTDASGAPIFIPVDKLAIDGNSTWSTNAKTITLDADSTDLVTLIKDDFERPDSDWLGYVSNTTTSWIRAFAGSSARISNGALAAHDESDALPSNALLYPDIQDGYVGATITDDPQASIRMHVAIPNSGSSVQIVARGTDGLLNYEGDINGVIVTLNRGDVSVDTLMEMATPTPAVTHSFTAVSDQFVQVDFIGDKIVVYVNYTKQLEYTCHSALLNNNVIGLSVDHQAIVKDFEFDGLRNDGYSQTLALSTVDGPDYPLDSWGWTLFEKTYTLTEGMVDDNGPWRDNVRPSNPSQSFIWKTINLSRADFGLPDTADYIPTWIGTKTKRGADAVTVWLDANTVAPYGDDGVYPNSAIRELYDGGLYGFESIVIKAKLRPEPDPHWYPQLNSGHFFLGEEERYLYADRKDEQFGTLTHTLQSPPRQGAPVLVYATNRQMLVSDTFNRPDSPTLGFTDGDGILDPVEWTGAEYEIKNGMAKTSGPTGSTIAKLDVTFSDFELLLDIPYESEDSTVLMLLRGQSDGAGYIFFLSRDTDESATPLDSPRFTYSFGIVGQTELLAHGYFSDRPYSVKIKALGERFTVYVNGQVISTFTDERATPNTSGTIAFYGFKENDSIDNLQIYSINNSTSSASYRQVAFLDDLGDQTLTNTEIIMGNGTDMLYCSYEDIYDIAVTDLVNEADVTYSITSSSNEIQVSESTSKHFAYKVDYKVKNSFMITSSKADGTQVHVDQLPADDMLTVTYEESIFNPATRIDIPLSPFHTKTEESFIFISEKEYDMGKIEVSASPQKIVASGDDYMVFHIRSFDVNGNPKPYQTFHVETTWGTLSGSIITTDHDGQGMLILQSSDTLPDPYGVNGEITVTGDTDFVVPFKIQPVLPKLPSLVAVPSSEEVSADGVNVVFLYGRLVSADLTPIGSESISYKKGRSLHDAFTSGTVDGIVVTNDDGRFEIGPFITSKQPGYWFVVIENEDKTAGDVVFWHEYATGTYGVNDMSGLPKPDLQMATPVSAVPPYINDYRFPFSYDADTYLPATPTTTNWLPPRWYSVDWFLQYQLGIITDAEYGDPTENYEHRVHNPNL